MTSATDAREAEAPRDDHRKPWHRPTFYVLSDLINTSGGSKNHNGVAISAEDETRHPTDPIPKGKNYRPISQ